MNAALENLTRCNDIDSLESALRAICSGIGPVDRLDILPMVDSGKRKAVCLVRLISAEHEDQLMAQLGAFHFGNDLCVVVDMKTPD